MNNTVVIIIIIRNNTAPSSPSSLKSVRLKPFLSKWGALPPGARGYEDNQDAGCRIMAEMGTIRRVPCKRRAPEGPAQCAEAAPPEPLRASCGACEAPVSRDSAPADGLMAEIRALGRLPRSRAADPAERGLYQRLAVERLMADIRALGRLPRASSVDSAERGLYHRLRRARGQERLSASHLAELAGLPRAALAPADAPVASCGAPQPAGSQASAAADPLMPETGAVGRMPCRRSVDSVARGLLWTLGRAKRRQFLSAPDFAELRDLARAALAPADPHL